MIIRRNRPERTGRPDGEDLGKPFVHRATGEFTHLVVHADQGVAGGDPHAGP